MNAHASPSLFWRLAVVLLAVLLLWLAQQAGRAGVAGIYAATAATYQQALDRSSDPVVREQLLSTGLGKINRASELMPAHPEFARQTVGFLVLERNMDPNIDPTLISTTSIDVLHTALTDSPVRADLWWRLAREEYEVAGVSPRTSHALAQALSYGPREPASLLLNAMLIFNAGEQFSTSERLRGWSAVVEAASIPGLEQEIHSMAMSAGKERQLQRLLLEKSRQKGRLQGPQDAP